jgi:membrane protease YdiL (CAAX protease family)
MNPRPLVSRIFISEPEPRLRAGWRILLQTFLLLFFSFLVVLPAQLFLQFTKPAPSTLLLLMQFASFAAFNISIFIARRYLDRRSFTSLGLQATGRVWRDLLAGFFIAGIMMGIIYLIERLAGWLNLASVAWQDTPVQEIILSIIIMLLVFIVTGWQEELYFRGYLLQNLSDGLNAGWGVAISSLIFGLAHLGNPNSALMGALGVTLAGLFMAYAYLRTRQLWLPIGLHIGWNFFEGPVLGFPVSGIGTFQLVRNQVAGPTLLTGGSFGPEAGLVLLPALVFGAALVYLYTHFSNR